MYKHRDLFRIKVFSHTNKHCWKLWYGAFRVNQFCHKILKHIKKLLCILCPSLAFRMTYTWVICILLYPIPTHIAMCGSNKVLGGGWSFLAFLNSLPRQPCASCPNIAYSVRYMINIECFFSPQKILACNIGSQWCQAGLFDWRSRRSRRSNYMSVTSKGSDDLAAESLKYDSQAKESNHSCCTTTINWLWGTYEAVVHTHSIFMYITLLCCMIILLYLLWDDSVYHPVARQLSLLL